MRAVLEPWPVRLEVALECRHRQVLGGGRPCVRLLVSAPQGMRTMRCSCWSGIGDGSVVTF